MKHLILSMILLSFNISFAETVSVDSLCEDYIVLSESNSLYKGKPELLQHCMNLKIEAEKNKKLKNSFLTFLSGNESLTTTFRQRTVTLKSTDLELDSLNCINTEDAKECTAQLSQDAKICEIGFTKVVVRFSDDLTTITSALGYSPAMCISR